MIEMHVITAVGRAPVECEKQSRSILCMRTYAAYVWLQLPFGLVRCNGAEPIRHAYR